MSNTLPATKTGLDRFQPEIQGLRAIAVLLVVVYHLWPNRLTGGFVGVDVFFVISGFLITSHIYREVRDTGRLKLSAFWARRVRRLLPLGFVVLAASTIMALAWVPATAWQTTFRQIIGSVLYVQNWILASDAVDYSAQDDSATVVQHYWSLSVEEQFYIVWPLLLVGLLFAVSKLRGRVGDSRKVLLWGLSAVGVVSLVWSIVATAYNPATAYFITPTRMWEFVAGALVALIFMGRQLRGTLGNILGWAGIGMLLASSIVYTSATPFPGYTALLPVVGTAIVIVAGSDKPFVGVHWWLSIKPAQFLGDVSYGVYLWHWPFIIALPFALDDNLRWWHKIALLVFFIALSWVTKTYVEDPFRIRSWIKPLPKAYGFAASGMVVVVAVSAALPPVLTNVQEGAAPSASSECYGYAAIANDCTPLEGEEAPPPAVAAEVGAQAREQTFPGCQSSETSEDIVTCDIGAEPETADAVVAVVGDSHATAWLPALETLGKERNWTFRSYTRSACTPSYAERADEAEAEGAQAEVMSSCTEHVREVSDIIENDPEIRAVFTAASRIDRAFVATPEFESEDPQIEGFTKMWQRWIDAGKEVVAINEVPRMNELNVPECVAENTDDLSACEVAEKDAVKKDANIKDAANTMDDPKFHQVDVTDGICVEGTCHSVIGSLVTYHDKSHLSVDYARSLAPLIDEQIEDVDLRS